MTESSTNHSAAFNVLRPACVQLTQEQTVQNVKNLHTQISKVEVSALQPLFDYILFPLRFSLKIPGPKKPNLVQSVLECVSYLLSHTHVQNEKTFQELFSEICGCIPSNSLHSVPEEMKLSAVSALSSLIQSTSTDVIPVLHKHSFLPELGYAISLLLRLAELEKSREIRLKSLTCLNCLLLQSSNQNAELGDLFASFLPGICTVLTRIINGDPKQGYKVTHSSLKLWTGIVSLVMSDNSLAHVVANKPVPTGISGRVAELLVHRNETWVKHTASRLFIHLDSITVRCTSDPHWKVRMQLIDLAQILLTNCRNSMVDSMGNLLKILVGHMNDERPEVKAKAKEILLEVAEEGPACNALKEVLSESLHSLAVTLPRLLSSQDDQGKLHTLGLLIGYLQLLGSQLMFTLHSQAHLQRLSSALLQTLELDFSSVKVVEEHLPSPSVPLGYSDPAPDTVQKKSFRFFRDSRVLSLIQSVCRLLGYHGDLCLLIDHFLGLYRAHRLPALIVLNQLVLGAAGIEVEILHLESCTPDSVELLDAVRLLLEEYTDPANWNLYTCQGSDELSDQLASLQIGSTKKYSISDLSANAWKLSLQLEGISCFAQALGPSFRRLLITTLYPVLEKAGDPSLLVSRTAILTLEDMSLACRYQDVRDLIEGNADYLASEVSVGLRRLHQMHGGAARVLHSMLENCGSTLLSLLGELVEDMLCALDQSQNEGACILFPVLKSLAVHLGKWFPPTNNHVTPELTEASVWVPENSKSLAQEIQDFVRDHIEQQRIASGDVLEEEENTDVPPPSEPVDDEKKPPMPIHIKISKEVAERCIHFLSHSDAKIRLQALDTLRLSLVILQTQQDVLLPLAHRIWPSLVKRLLQDGPLVLLRAFQVLESLVSSCRDFLRQRVCKDALPAFLNSLRSQAPVSARASPIYSHTLGFKLQLALLEGLGTLCVALGLGDGDLLEVLDSCMLYLSVRQPSKLQETAFSVFLSVARLDPDIVWHYLCEWQSPPTTPHPSLITLPWAGKTNDEYTQNVCKILQKLP
ncbi:TELO2-interacting protein 1 homolog [Bombina bombina]|uniref:TELO2-interacting protein 1 homolog n=1 Tax=Bombina bombina TaxID=8345 RepID=UPI00235A8C74|nr:TELO2-interacting protein 1 homolog [Bombina bombina]XP_053574125.1 TELO2-interacting protein 1 homolog [Bombina bombina]